LIDIAARLMVTAESILCDEKTYNAAKGDFNFEQKPPLSVKGSDKLVTAYKLL